MAADPIADFRAALAEAGLEPGEIIADGRLRRCPVAGKPHGQDGAYCLHLDAPASGFWQNWRAGTSGKWKTPGERDMGPAERDALRRRAEADRKARQREQDKRHAEAADRARSILAAALACPADHAYLTRKGIPPLGGIRLGTDGALLLPLENERGDVQGLQRIMPDGAKRFLPGTKKAGSFAVIPGDSGRLFLVEGYATGASVHLATGGTVLVCLDCGNLMAVARIARRRYPKREIVIAGDNDHGTEGNPGLTKAREAAQAIGGLLAVPSFAPGEPGTDWNDLHTA
jgi:putative DNA primase/helicase